MDNAAAFYTLYGVLVDLCGVDPADAEGIIQELVDDYGYPDLIWDVEISIAAHMAGGLEMWHSPNAEELWHDGKGIDHLGTDVVTFEEDIVGVAATYGYDLEACE